MRLHCRPFLHGIPEDMATIEKARQDLEKHGKILKSTARS
jgi:hypothetical protein